ncbi:MAG: hypothetical protein ACKVI4_03625 [Actinomycetales bacterium]
MKRDDKWYEQPTALVIYGVVTLGIVAVGFARFFLQIDELDRAGDDVLRDVSLFAVSIAAAFFAVALVALASLPLLVPIWARRQIAQLHLRYPTALVAMIGGIRLADTTQQSPRASKYSAGSFGFLVVQSKEASVWRGRASKKKMVSVPTDSITRVFQSSEATSKFSYAAANIESSEWREPLQFSVLSTDGPVLRQMDSRLLRVHVEQLEQFLRVSRG